MWWRFLLKVRKLADLYFLMRMYKPAYNYAYISKKDFQTDEVRNFLFFNILVTLLHVNLLRLGLTMQPRRSWPPFACSCSPPLTLVSFFSAHSCSSEYLKILRSFSLSTLTPITPFPSEHLAEAAEFAGMFQNYDEFSWKSKQFQEHEALKCLK